MKEFFDMIIPLNSEYIHDCAFNFWHVTALSQARSLLYELHKDLEVIRELPLNTDPTTCPDVSTHSIAPPSIGYSGFIMFSMLFKKINYKVFGIWTQEEKTFSAIQTVEMKKSICDFNTIIMKPFEK